MFRFNFHIYIQRGTLSNYRLELSMINNPWILYVGLLIFHHLYYFLPRLLSCYNTYIQKENARMKRTQVLVVHKLDIIFLMAQTTT